jgi:predicted ribosomally synthesized peptide with nif11-like leader
MSGDQLKAFQESVKADTTLQEKLKAAADTDAVIAIAKDAGFVIAAEDLLNTQKELSDEELEGVAGGKIYGNTARIACGQNFTKTCRHAFDHTC